jgi:hypothetical protein
MVGEYLWTKRGLSSSKLREFLREFIPGCLLVGLDLHLTARKIEYSYLFKAQCLTQLCRAFSRKFETSCFVCPIISALGGFEVQN